MSRLRARLDRLERRGAADRTGIIVVELTEPEIGPDGCAIPAPCEIIVTFEDDPATADAEAST